MSEPLLFLYTSPINGYFSWLVRDVVHLQPPLSCPPHRKRFCLMNFCSYYSAHGSAPTVRWGVLIDARYSSEHYSDGYTKIIPNIVVKWCKWVVVAGTLHPFDQCATSPTTSASPTTPVSLMSGYSSPTAGTSISLWRSRWGRDLNFFGKVWFFLETCMCILIANLCNIWGFCCMTYVQNLIFMML